MWVGPDMGSVKVRTRGHWEAALPSTEAACGCVAADPRLLPVTPLMPLGEHDQHLERRRCAPIKALVVAIGGGG